MGQLNPYDIQDIKLTVREMIRGRENLINIFYASGVVLDPYYDTPISYLSGVVGVSGVIEKIHEEDVLLKMSGKLKIGDTKLIFYYDDLVTMIDVSKLLEPETKLEVPAGSGRFYLTEAIDENGIKISNRYMLGLTESIP